MEYIAFEHQEKFYIALSRELLSDIGYLFNKDIMALYINDNELASHWGYQPIIENKNKLSQVIQDKLKPLGKGYGTEELDDREEYEKSIRVAEFAVKVAKTFVRPLNHRASQEFKLYE